jgi:DNA repair protein RecN (Recombination protein N)
MLRELRIRNLAVIESIDVEFRPGLNVLTGETGAGKSIVIDAILLVGGGRAQADLIRSGAETAVVEATFDIDGGHEVRDLLAPAGLDLDAGQLLIRRELSRSGRHRAFVNDSAVTLGLLERLGEQLVEVHGQHEHQRLTAPAHQLEVLDRFAGAAEIRQRVARLVEEYQAARKDIEEATGRERDRQQRQDLLRFQVSEIDAARLASGEEELLRTERRRLQHAERFTGGLTEAAALLYDDPLAAAGRLARAAQILQTLGRLDPELGRPGDAVEAAASHVEEAVGQIRRLRDAIVFEPARLEEIDARLDAIMRLKRKYGESVETVLAYRDEIGAELDRLSRHAAILEGQVRQAATLEAELASVAATLSSLRQAAADRLAAATQRALRELGMERAVFQMVLDRLDAVAASGMDRVEFRLSTNPGEAPKALARIASGGELSRAMLALTSVLAADEGTPTMVFDEVDAGIGGSVADTVGEKLAQTGRGRQVLCVTHLAPIVAHAGWHLHVAKTVRGGRTRTTVEALAGDARVEEIARMLGGEVATESARRHARALLDARRIRLPKPVERAMRARVKHDVERASRVRGVD